MPRVNHEMLASTQRDRITLRKKLVDVFTKKRDEMGCTDIALCQSIGIPPYRMKRILAGEGQDVTLDCLVLLLSRLGVNVDFVISEGGQ